MRWMIWIILLLPFCYLVYGVLNEISPDPVKFIYEVTGLSALFILLLMLSISTLKRLLHVNLLKFRRLVGLFAFFYAFLHFVNFFVIDAGLDFTFVLRESFDKPFIFAGQALFLILLFMAFTSTRTLFRKFGKYHKIVYLGVVLGVIHFAMSQKVLDIWVYFAIFSTIVLLSERLHVKLKQKG